MSRTARSPALVLIACVASAAAQPLPPTVTDRDTLRQIEMPQEFGVTVWRTPAPHELDWCVAYDETPLTVDAPEIVVRLVNNGRPVRLPPIDNGGPTTATLELTRPDSSIESIGPIERAVFAYTFGRNNGRIDPGRPVAGMRVKLLERFGALEAGEHTLRISIDVPRRLERARDAHVISPRLRLDAPPLRFRVLDGPLPSSADPPRPIRYDSLPDQQSGRVRATLTNPFEVPISLHADLGFDPARTPTPAAPTPLYNAVECWTETGWVRDTRLGYCGVGMTEITVPPGASIPVHLHTPRHAGSGAGIIRCVVSVRTPSGESVGLTSDPIPRGHAYRRSPSRREPTPKAP